jgi:hypothetical protein
MEALGVFVLVLSVVNLLLLSFVAKTITDRVNLLNNRRQDDIADLNEQVEILQSQNDKFRNWMQWKSEPHNANDLYELLQALNMSVRVVKGKDLVESAKNFLEAINEHNERRR